MTRSTKSFYYFAAFAGVAVGGIGGAKYSTAQLAEKARAEHAAAVEMAKMEHARAIADSDEITEGIDNYGELKNRSLELKNDKIRLKNDILDFEIAGLRGQRQNRTRIDKDLAIIRSDQEALNRSTQMSF
jgi:hypothetical protein